jgi:hypothetical protein
MFVSSLFLFQPLAAVLHVVNARLFGWTGSGGVLADISLMGLAQSCAE